MTSTQPTPHRVSSFMDFRGIPAEWEYSITELSGLVRHLPAVMFVENSGQMYPPDGLVVVPQKDSAVLVMKDREPLCSVKRPTVELSAYVTGADHHAIPVELEPMYRKWIACVAQPALVSAGWSVTEPERVESVARRSPHGPFKVGWLRYTLRCDEQTVEGRARRVRWLAACFQKVEAVKAQRVLADLELVAGREL